MGTPMVRGNTLILDALGVTPDLGLPHQMMAETDVINLVEGIVFGAAVD
jgi:hypothetical protein